MRIAFGTDERTPLTAAVVGRLRAAGHDVTVVAKGSDWSDADSEEAPLIARVEPQR